MRLVLPAAVAAVVLGVAPRADVAAADPAPTFTRDVAPILFAHCSSCHRPDEVGPFPLLAYEDARKRARQLARVTGDRVMPPWKPAAGHDVFKDARVLTDAQVGVFRAWADAGATEGDPKDLPPRPAYPSGWHLGEPDLVLTVAAPFTVPAEGPDVYVHFVLPLDFKEDKYLRAVQVRPSNRRVAHHGVPMLDGSGTARRLAKKHGGDRYLNSGGPGFIPRGFLPGYAPGQVTRVDPDDPSGFTLGKGMDVVLQMHYHPTGKEETDRPQVGLYFTDVKPKRNPCVVALANNDVAIPAGEKTYRRADSFTLPADFLASNVWAHMHMIGRDVSVTAALPDGTTKELLRVPDWDFNWQDTYRYKAPVLLPKGTVVTAAFTWDNSADNPRNPNRPPKLVSWGEGSTDEMSGLILGGVTARPQDELGMWGAVIGHYFEVEARDNAARKKREADAKRK